MSNALELRIPATAAGLATALARIDQFQVGRNLDVGAVTQARLVVEELISNTIKYGYRGESDRPILLRLLGEPVLTLIYEDRADPFDPTVWRPPEAWTAANREEQEGRSGIALVIGLSSTIAYERVPDGNRLLITFDGAGGGE